MLKEHFVIITLFLLFNACGKSDCSINSCSAGAECIEGYCVDITPLCEACGTYEGLASGIIETQFSDSFYIDVPIRIYSSEDSIAYEYTIGIDVSAFLGSPTNTLVLEVVATLNEDEITFSNETYSYQGIATIYIDGMITFNENFNELIGEVQLSGDVMGDITFQAVR